MTEIENKKLELEVQELERSIKRNRFKFIVDLLQGVVIIVGVIVTVNEFILKDRESKNQKSKITLEYVQKITDKEIVVAKDSLIYFRDITMALAHGDPKEDSLSQKISDRFDKATMNLSHYYNVLNEGVSNGYFDKNISKTFLAFEVNETIEVLSELQSRVGIPGESKEKFFYYKRFKGLIEFYISCNDITGDDLKRLPKYDTNKPYTLK